MRMKSILLTPVLVLLSGISIYGIYASINGGLSVAWAGVVLAAGPLPAFVSYVMLTEQLARTSENLPGAIVISGIGCLLTFVAFNGVLPSILAISSLLMLLWYIFIYSRFGRTNSSALKVGNKLPDFSLQDMDGQAVSSTAFQNHSCLFLFFRGNWCPLCMAQIQEVADAYKQLAALGIEVILVSPQPHEQTAKLAKKFDVPFRFLVDENLKVARKLDILASGGTPIGIDALGYGSDTVMPTVIGTDNTGQVIFLDETDNYRVRPEPETFLKLFNDKLEPVGNA